MPGALGTAPHTPAVGAEADTRYHGDILGDLFRAQPAVAPSQSAVREGSPIPRGITLPLTPSPPPKPALSAGDIPFGAPASSYATPYITGTPQPAADLRDPMSSLASYTSQIPRASFPLGKDGPLVGMPLDNPQRTMDTQSPARQTGPPLLHSPPPPQLPPSEPTMQATEKPRSATVSVLDSERDGNSSSEYPVLQGYNPNTWDPPLHYGDTISLLVDGLNALTAYAGTEDGLAWIETLQVLLMCL